MNELAELLTEEVADRFAWEVIGVVDRSGKRV